MKPQLKVRIITDARVGTSTELFSLHFWRRRGYYLLVTVETFRPELLEAMRAYDRYVICIDKIPEEFETSLISLLHKAIKAYESRGPQLRHGIALDKHVTVILSQNDTPRPLCGIYFNLHSPYQRQSLPKTVKPLVESVTEKQPE